LIFNDNVLTVCDVIFGAFLGMEHFKQIQISFKSRG